MPPKRGRATKAKSNAKEPEAATNGAPDASDETTKAEETTVAEDAPAPEQENTQLDEAPAPEEEHSAQPETSGGAEEKEKEEKAAPKPSKKRKAEDVPKEATKASRRSVRGAAKAQPSQLDLLNYLLSDAAADMCRPNDEVKDIEAHGKDIRTYSNSALNPFEELLCAVVLSRPISHRLGLRTIRTILNEPYSFTSPKAIKDAGSEKQHQALYDAHTQHKDKTAEQIGLIADVVASQFGKNDSDTSLDKMRDKASKDWDQERDLLQSSIKGLGKTGLDIFFRRVQWLWPEAYPFVDERTGRGLEKLTLPKNPEALQKLLEQHWAKLDTSALAKGDRNAQKRRAFVVVCERATGADLEGKSEALLEAAATS